MDKKKILVTMANNDVLNSFYNDELRQKLNELGDVTWYQGTDFMTTEELIESIPGVNILVTGWGQPYLTDEVLKAADSLELVAHTAGSTASICGGECYDKDITVISGNNVFAESVAEATLCYILASLRRLNFYDQQMKDGGWRESFDNQGLFGKKIGLVAFGTIPRYLIPMLKPFRCEIVAYDPYVSAEEMAEYGVKKAELDDLFKTSDIVSLHLPLKPDTIEMINKDHLDMLKDGAVLINTGRGATIDEDALAEVLSEGRIHSVLDVFRVEPLPQDSPLRSTPNTILNPHMAGPTFDRRVDATSEVIKDIERYINNQNLENEITREKAMNMTQRSMEINTEKFYSPNPEDKDEK